jgi:hypothetical protein
MLKSKRIKKYARTCTYCSQLFFNTNPANFSKTLPLIDYKKIPFVIANRQLLQKTIFIVKKDHTSTPEPYDG